MTYLQSIILGIVQGLTEFLPISSDAHLFLVRTLLHWPDQGVLFDAVLHAGTLAAVIVGVASGWRRFLRGLVSVVRDRHFWQTPDQRLFSLIVIGTLPGAVGGFLAQKLFGEPYRGVAIIALWLVLSGVFYLIAEAVASQRTSSADPAALSLAGVLWIGVAQLAAGLLPGASRSGMTIATGLLSRLTRTAAAEFSFLLAGPITLGAVIVSVLQLRSEPVGAVAWGPLLVGVVVAFVVGLGALRFMLRLVKTWTLAPFAIYKFTLAALLIVLVLLRVV